MHVTLNKPCVCIRGKKNDFIRGKRYMVSYLFQNQDGDFMVNVNTEVNWSVNCYAKRFLMPTDIKLTV